MLKSGNANPSTKIAANVQAALTVAEAEKYKLVAYFCRMILEELHLLEAKEYQKSVEDSCERTH